MTQYKYLLEEKDMPTQWYNIIADMKISAAALPASGNAGADGPGRSGPCLSPWR